MDEDSAARFIVEISVGLLQQLKTQKAVQRKNTPFGGLTSLYGQQSRLRRSPSDLSTDSDSQEQQYQQQQQQSNLQKPQYQSTRQQQNQDSQQQPMWFGKSNTPQSNEIDQEAIKQKS